MQEERQRKDKHQYFNGTVIQIGGATFFHNVISSNLHFLLRQWLVGQKDTFYVCQSDLKVHNELANTYTYPDIVVIENEPNFVDNTFDTITNPLLLVEVLSSSTGNYDKTDKYLIYKELKSLKEYVLVHQKKQEITIFRRESAHKWTVETCKPERNPTIKLESVNLEISFADIYQNVKF